MVGCEGGCIKSDEDREKERVTERGKEKNE